MTLQEPLAVAGPPPGLSSGISEDSDHSLSADGPAAPQVESNTFAGRRRQLRVDLSNASTAADESEVFTSEDKSQDQKALALESINAHIGKLGLGMSTTDTKAVVEAFQVQVNEKAEEMVAALKQKCQKKLEAIQTNTLRKSELIAEEMQRMEAEQKKMEADNKQLGQMVADLAQKLATALGEHPLTAATQEANGNAAKLPQTPIGMPPGLTQIGASSDNTTNGAEAATKEGGDGYKNEKSTKKQLPNFPFPIAGPEVAGASGTTSPVHTPVLGPSAPPRKRLGSTMADSLMSTPVLGGAETRHRISLTDSLPATPKVEPASPSPLMVNSSGTWKFSFQLMKAYGTELGLGLSISAADSILLVESVKPEGAVEAWNRQCFGTKNQYKAVLPGDMLVQVNEQSGDPAKMLAEMKEKQLLKFTMSRTAPVYSPTVGQPGMQPPWASPYMPAQSPVLTPAQSPGALRAKALSADAPVFLPSSSPTASP